MFGSTSSSQPGFGGSGALSHAYLQYPPLKCRYDGSRGLFYDDGNKLLISPTTDQVVSWKISPFSSDVAPTTDTISEGPILSVRYSLDSKLIAVQRSNHEVQFWVRETGETFSQKSKSESDSILGFFWTDCAVCDIVFVKTSGLDLYTYMPELKSLDLVETKKMNVSWYIYTHESRLVLLASGMQCKSFTGYQLSAAGVIRLPRFEMAMAKLDANSKPVLAAEDVHIVTVYGRIYCLQVDRVAMLLHSYRFYRDAVIQQGSLPIYSSKIAVSVVDNVLLIHQVDAKVILLYDIFADSRTPVSAPLPLLIRGSPSRTNAQSSETTLTNNATANLYGDDWIFLVPDLVCDVSNGFLWKIHLDLEAISASNSEVPAVLEFLQRRKLEAKKAKHLCLELARSVIIERRPLPMVFWAIDVLLKSFAYSLKTGSYLKGGKPEKPTVSGAPENSESGKSVKNESASGVESRTVHNSGFSTSDSEDNNNNNNTNVRNVKAKNININITTNSSSENIEEASRIGDHSVNQPLNANVSEQQESQVTSAAIPPDELYSFVFASVEEEMIADASYLFAIVVELIRSASLEKIKLHPNIYVLAVRLLARNERYAELGLFIMNKIIEPSKEVALQLLETGHQNIQTRKLGLDMMRQLMLHHDYIVLLVQDGCYLEALRFARKNKVNTVRPSLFLEAAYASNDPQHLAAVLRFFRDFIPGFATTSEHSTFVRALADMTPSVAA
ncbi:putative regulator of MON1-CCZ1 complex [Helianthus annuus]|uniref:Regulator of MON1-CCZ1 complex n=1 Tax=Helianthus annuus TaxID=4232 RepID=A0A251SRD5_HELAN|nr:regulator of MON1-CCZ1 complex isoform X2 [Helianthus annuus]XP_035837876.1 regulator of MON1-CCZ1 complex isoform X2 [Helianthus annuus]KAF5772864.1 putative regulator of MON1-CCZ1 complex [Helianthus annuus]KAJ0670778.1 putative regulator of MON1-CCZ1 complex [Helianthus annuus]KAJ0857679.1 putative regulator of MON1-CCZ1 complex [Helianthus annuus]